MAVADFFAWPDSPAGVGAAMALAFVFGSMVGSFLNVVVHRVPRGETVVFGRSRCPACGATIRARDNVPLVGWLLLRGRCRECGVAIPARYPLVEAACGGLLTLLAAAELAAAPAGDGSAPALAWAGRAAIAMTLVAWGLLAARGHVVGATTVAWAVATAVLAAVTLPPLHPAGMGCPASTAGGPPVAWPECLAAAGTGLVAGCVAGAIVGRRTAAVACCCLVGASLGWQAAVLAAIAIAVGGLSGWGGAAAWSTLAVVGWRPLSWAWAGLCRWIAGG